MTDDDPQPHTPVGPLRGKRIGHTFTKHGSHNTTHLTREALGSGRPVGQWTDDAAAEAFIAGLLPALAAGPITVPLPPGLGRQINPDGTTVPANRATLVPSNTGVKTAFPFAEEVR